MAWSLSSLWRWTSGGVLRSLGYTYEEPRQLPQGMASTSPEAPAYDAVKSLSAFAAFPWVRACVDAIGEDLAGLPLVAYRGEGKDARRLDGHPALDLLAAPTSYQSREEWERQLVLYWLLTGNAWALRVGTDRAITSLPLLHPERVRLVADELGQPQGIEYRPEQGRSHYYPWDRVLHWHLSSWQGGAQGLLGEGLITALSGDLAAEKAATRLAATTASRGRPEVVISPRADGVTLKKEQREEIADAYARFVAENKPALVLGGDLNVETKAYTPRDLEFAEQRELTRETVLAAFGVPPTRVGLPTANYATSRQQDEVYWRTLVGRASMIDGVYTRIARAIDPLVTIRHDFAGVPALQESRTERLRRAADWVLLMGATPAAAAAYEGFDDAPVSAEVDDTPSATSDEERGARLRHLFPVAGSSPLVVVRAPLAVPSGEAERAALWRGWLDEVHTPAEVRLARATRAMLAAQAERVARRMEATAARGLIAERRDIVSDLLSLIFPVAEETAAMRDGWRDAVRRMVVDAYTSGARQVGSRRLLDEGRADAYTDSTLGLMITRTTPTSQAAVRAIVVNGIENGMGANEMAEAIRRDAGFAPSRSLLIARTETTRSLATGHDAAYADYATDEGLSVSRQWLSARDATVRDAHIVLDGQVRALGEDFVIPASPLVDVAHVGASARGPGEFAAPALVCNCRCTTVPIVEDAA